jgi:hypothetical protein
MRTMGSGFKVKIFTKKLLALDHFGPRGDFLCLSHCLLRETVSDLLVPALTGGEFLFEIPSLCSASLLGLGLCCIVESELVFRVGANFRTSSGWRLWSWRVELFKVTSCCGCHLYLPATYQRHQGCTCTPSIWPR